ncbi:peptidylprolyl isomerase [Candidatus Halobeggiatoa sp. HSG11]|nr:peptidylprolyl isomerase [Candidatus Halobeggiatoa sp. HSG11]
MKYNVLLLILLPTLAYAQLLDYIVAIVDDDVIVNTNLQQEMQDVTTRLQQQNISLPPTKELERQVLEKMVLTSLQLQLAKRIGINVEDSSLNERLRKIAAKNNLDLQSFKTKIEAENRNYEQVREQIRKDMIIHRLQQRQVASRISITDREVDNFLDNKEKQEATSSEYHIRHILIETPDSPSPEAIKISKQKAEDAVAKLKQGHNFQAMAVAISNSGQALEGGDLGWMTIGEMPTLFAGVVNQMKIGEIVGPLRDSNGFHIIKLANKNIGEQSIITQTKAQHILLTVNDFISDDDARNHLEELKARIEQGDKFADLARANSNDSNSAAKGGDLGWLSPGDVVSEFEAVINTLEINQLSEPFKSRYGWHIVQVLQRRKHDNTEEVIRTEATKQIHQRKINEELQAWLRQLRDEAFVSFKLGIF